MELFCAYMFYMWIRFSMILFFEGAFWLLLQQQTPINDERKYVT